MKYLAVIILLFSTAAFAGENRNNSQNASARAAALAVGIAGAKGGTASASSGSGDSLYLNIPGAASVGAAGAHPCGLSTGWSIPIFTYNSVELEPFCALAKQADWVCRRAGRNPALAGRCRELTDQAANFGKKEVVASTPVRLVKTASSGKDSDDLACVLGWKVSYLDC